MGRVREIWVYQGPFGRGKDFKWESLAEFRRSFTIDQAIGYLGTIKKTLRQEAYKSPRKKDYYTGLRHVFSEIDGLGKLIRGDIGKGGSSANGITFGDSYLAQVNPQYKELIGLLIDMYRHGLAHTHLTKCVRMQSANGRAMTLGWGIETTASKKARHLAIQKRDRSFYLLWVHVPQLIEDTLAAIDLYAADIRLAGVRSTQFENFKRGYIGTASVFHEPMSIGTAASAGKKKGPLVLTLSGYSRDGIELVRREIAGGRAT